MNKIMLVVSCVAITLCVTLATVSPVSGQSCDNASGVWRAEARDLSDMVVAPIGACAFRATFTGLTGVSHVVEGIAGVDRAMTVTRTDTAGCVTRMYGNVFVAPDGRNLWWSIVRTDGRCGLPAGYSETRRFALVGVSRPTLEAREPRGTAPEPDRRPAVIGPHVPALLEPLREVVKDTVDKVQQRSASDDDAYRELQNKGRTSPSPSPSPSASPEPKRDPSGNAGNKGGGGGGGGNSNGEGGKSGGREHVGSGEHR